MSEAWLYPLLVLVAAAAATYFWRLLGVTLSGRINPNSALFAWLACVAYALLAGLITRMLLLPVGPMAEAPLAARLAAAGLCLLCYRLTASVLGAITVGGAALAIWLLVAPRLAA